MAAPPGSGSSAACLSGRSMLILWENTPEHLIALVAGSGCFSPWLDPWEGENVAIALTGPESRPALGAPPAPGRPPLVGSPAETGLPWTLRVSSADPARENDFVS